MLKDCLYVLVAQSVPPEYKHYKIAVCFGHPVGLVNRRWQAFTGMTSSSLDSDVTTSAISVSDCLSKCEQREIMTSCVATRYDSSTKTCTLMNNYATELTSNLNEHYLELIDGKYKALVIMCTS